jgi:hypothetical protein
MRASREGKAKPAPTVRGASGRSMPLGTKELGGAGGVGEGGRVNADVQRAAHP